MPLKLRPTGLGSGIDKDRPDYTVYCGTSMMGRPEAFSHFIDPFEARPPAASYPVSFRPWRNPRNTSESTSGDWLLRNPITGIFGCCAHSL